MTSRHREVIITEHTTGDEPFCVVESPDGSKSGEFFGSIEEFRADYPDVIIVEEVWS